MKDSIKTAFVIIATLVGAGFASGKEIYSFFLIYGINGIFGICISALLISVVVYKVYKICNVNHINDYKGFCEHIIHKNTFVKKLGLTKKLSIWLSNVINILLLITFFVMISGFSSFLKQEFYINKFLGSVIIVILCYITFQKNVEGLIKISNYLIPILIVFLLLISSKNLEIVHNYNNVSGDFLNSYTLIAILSAILYGSYNCILLIPVLITLIGAMKNTRKIMTVSVCSFILITLLSLSVYNILLLGDSNIFSLEMPVIEIVKRYGNGYKYIYLAMIGGAIYTTAISTGCGFLNGVSKDRGSFKRKSFLMCVVAVFLSQISFSLLVECLYPVLGVIGIMELMLLFCCRG